MQKVVKLLKFFVFLSMLSILFVMSVYAETSETVFNFPYTGRAQEWIAPTDGVYFMETWGASGGYRGGDNSGAGGYSSGYLYAKKGDRFYVYVGGSGQTHQGFNGGGYRSTFNHYGGGATDIRFNTDSLYSRLIVAGGGGTDGADGNGGGAGGATGGSTGGYGSGGVGASLTGAGANNGTFGSGGPGYSAAGGHAGAGGGGWYGGGGAYPDGSGDDDRGGGGGSSFIWNEGTTGNVPSGYTVPSRLMMYNFSYSTGVRRGDGLAKITTIQPDGIASIKLNNGSVNLNYNYKQKRYVVTVSNDVPSVMFNVTPKEGYSISYSQRNLDLSSTTGTELITVTHDATGISEVYTIVVNQVNNYLKGSGNNVYYDIPYTGEYQEFYIPSTGTWTVEVWGAQGAGRGGAGGRGAYTVADVDFSKGQKLYLWVGGAGDTLNIDGRTKGFNGGGYPYTYFSYGGFYQAPTNVYGGGATDVRIGGNTLYHRLIVAAGGGAGSRGGAGGAGCLSSSGGYGSYGTAGGATGGGTYNGVWGKGGTEIAYAGGYGGPGGGGWYGGGARYPDGSGDDDGGGGGGSSFIWSQSSVGTVPADYAVSDKFYMSNGFIHHGGETFKSPYGGNETGHGGNGYIRLTPKLLNGIDSISINGGKIPIDFDYTKYDYTVTVDDSTEYINVHAIIADGFSYTENHSGNYNFSDINQKEYLYTLTVINDITGLSRTYNITFRKASYYWQPGSTGSYGYGCTKDVQEFVAPASGIYTVEAWGAQGQNTGAAGGNGSYAKGNMFLSKGETVYVYVGCSGANGGYNGGGDAYWYRDGNQNIVIPWGIRGGGASDIRLGGKTLYHRVLVAAGGGGAGASGTGGPGDAEGNNGGYGSQGNRGTMSGGGWADGSWGQGAQQYAANGGYSGPGGGGWYGGGHGYPDGSGNDDKGGGGGSSYIWSAEYASYAPADYEVSRTHFLTNPTILNGYSTMPNHTNTGTMTGNAGDGYVRFDFSLSYKYKIVVSDNVTLDNEFDYDRKSYIGTVENTSSIVNFDVDLTDDESVLTYQNAGDHEIHVGENNYPISITYVNGAVDIFNYKIDREANDVDILNDLKINDLPLSEYGSPDFSSGRYDYTISLPYSLDEYDLNISKGSADQVFDIYSSIDPDHKFTVEESIAHINEKHNSYDLVIKVTNETNTSSKTYTLHVTLPHSSKLKKLVLESGAGNQFEYLMEDGKEVYNIELESYVATAKALPEVYDAEATFEIIGDGYISSDIYTIVINVSEPHVDPTTYIFNIKRISIGGFEKDVGYTGTCTTFVVPYDHEYLLETWGAQGGYGGGRGGYSKGEVYLEKGTVLYLCAGGSGDNGGFNGGGSSRAGYGGGASDIRLGTNSVYARILIAGGGGGHGSDGCAFGGVGGGENGGGKNGQGSCGTNAGGGSQTTGGTYGITGGARGNVGRFAVGAAGPNSGGGYYGGGGGGGFYGGGSGATSGWSSGGGGGSGFIYNEESYTMVTDLLSETFGGGKWLVSEDYLLKNAQTLTGSESFPTTNHAGTETGHGGNGFVKVSIPYQKSENNFLSGIISNRGVMRQEWDYNLSEYDLDLDSKDTEINIEGVPADDRASVAGNGDYIIPAGDTDIILTVTSESGLIKTYSLHVHREVDHNPYPNKIAVDGMIETYCALGDDYCIYAWDRDIEEYYIVVPYQIREINMTVDKGHYFQEIIGDGIYKLDGGLNDTINIKVTAEDKENIKEYNYNIFRDMTGNADLVSLEVTNPETKLNYSFNVTDYYITVANEVENIEIEAIPDDPRATVEIDNIETLEYGSDNDIPITVTAENGAIKIYTIHVTRLKSDNAFLGSLSINNITNGADEALTLVPEFTKGTTEYVVKVTNDITNIRLDATVEKEEFATLEGAGEKTLRVGRNEFTITVTAQDETTLDYHIIVMRDANSNALLSNLEVFNKDNNKIDFTESFESEKFLYYIYVPATIESVKITATPEEDTTTYRVVSGNINYLEKGKNTITVRATAEDGSYNDYTILIIRTAYTDNDLVSLVVTNGQEAYILTPEFDPVNENYTLTVPTEVEHVRVTAMANRDERAVIGSNYIFTEDVNMLSTNPYERTIAVTSEEGVIHNYTIKITRTKSTDNTLKSLTVTGHELIPSFDPEETRYTFITTNHDLSIEAIPNSKYAHVNISKTSLDEGDNIITITVTPEEGDQKVYTLVVTRILSNDANLSGLYVSSGYTPSFEAGTYTYSSQTHDSSVVITPTLSSHWASYKIFDDQENEFTELPNIVLNVGENHFRIEVSAENGDTLNYYVNIERILNKNPNLSSLSISGHEISFDSDTTEYTVNTHAHDFDISATMEDSTYAIYEIIEDDNVISGHITFNQYDNVTRTITVRGYAEDRSITKDYVITVNRTPNDNALIKSFGITTTPSIKDNVRNYTATCDETKLDLSRLELYDNWASFEVEGNENFETPGETYSVTITVTAEDGEATEEYTIEVFRVQSTDPRLGTLSFGDISLNSEFNSDKTDYIIYIDNDVITLDLDTQTLKDTARITSITINNDEVLSENLRRFNGTITVPTVGETITRAIVIKTIAEDGETEKTYTVEIRSTDNLNNYLASLQVVYQDGEDEIEGVYTPEFDKEVGDYYINLPSGTSSITIAALPEVTSSIVTGNITYEFRTGENTKDFKITVEPLEGSKRDYILHVTREMSSNSKIKSLSFKDSSITFDGFDTDTYEYNVHVPNNIKELTLDMLNYEMEDPTAYAMMSSCKLSSREEKVCTIYGVAENGSKTEYHFTVTREKGHESRLKTLSFGDYKFDEGDFDPDIKAYTLRVPKTKATLGRSDLSYTLMDDEAIVSFPADITLNFNSNDNNYIITSTASDGETVSRYIINVTHILSTDNTIHSINIDDNIIEFTREFNNETSPVYEYGIFDDENSAELKNIVLNNEDGSHNITLPKTLTLGKDTIVAVTAENGDVKNYTMRVVQNKTRNLKLQSLSVSLANTFDCTGICTLDHQYDPDAKVENNDFTFTVPFGVNSVDIAVTLQSRFQSYEIIGNDGFTTGENTVIVRVYNSLDEYKDYTIVVTREPSHEANLRNIAFSVPEQELEGFVEDVYEYNTEFSRLESGRYRFNITKKDEGQTYQINGSQVLYYGNNDIYVDTFSESCFSDTKSRYGCEQQRYLIHAYRFENWSNLLNSINISSGDSGNLLQDFLKYKFDYVLTVPSEVSKVLIESIPAASDNEGNYHATVAGDGEYRLNLGLNTVKLIVTPEDGEDRIYTINIIRSSSDNVNLESLEIPGHIYSPTFSKNIVDYYLTVDDSVTSLPLRYVPESSESTVYVSGNSNLVTGENLVSIVVLSADKTRGKTYRIHVTKTASNDNYLASLTAKSVVNSELITHELDPEFDKDEPRYTINVNEYTDNIQFIATPNHPLASVVGAGPKALDYGDNEFTISVTSESGQVNNYMITVKRAYNINLKELSVKSFELEPTEYLENFDKTIREYTVNVPYETRQVDITGIAEEEGSTVEGLDVYALHTGVNDVEITVRYQDKATGTYLLHINRAKNNDSKLANLEVEEGVIIPTFDPDVTSYTVTIPFEYDAITPIYTVSDTENARVEIINNGSLEVDVPKDVTVRCFAEDNTYTDYVITVTRSSKSKSSNYLSNLYLEEMPFDRPFTRENLNYSVDVEKGQNRVTLHILPESTYSILEVYRADQTNIVRRVDAKLADPNLSLTLQTGRNPYIVRVTNEEGLIRNYKVDIYRSGTAEARIKKLEFDHGVISPGFDKNNTNYTVNLDNEYKNLAISNIVMVDPNATYEIFGNKKLTTGENTVTIVTTAEDGKTHMTYTFKVNRKKSDNAYLSMIATFPEFDDDYWDFDKEKYQYTLEIEPDVTQVQIIGVREDTSAYITGNGIYKITQDTTTINLVVTSESEIVTRTYTVNIVRKKDSNNYLRSLTTNNGQLVPEFDKETQDYTITVENVVDSITLHGIAESSLATVTGNVQNKALVEGENRFAITVKAQNNTTRTYNIVVTRKENEQNKLQLDSLSVKEGDLTPSFAPSIFDYVVYVPNENETATITFKRHDPDAIVSINWVKEETDTKSVPLEVGHNTIEIRVSKDDDTRLYTLDIIRQEASNTYLQDLAVIGYNISPEFDKTNQEYTLTVGNNVSSINAKAIVEASTSKLYFKLNDGDYAISNGYNNNIALSNGENVIYYKVVSKSNIERVYKMKITREASDGNKLLTFRPSVGTLTEEFDPDKNIYTIELPTGTTTVKFTGTYSPGATQTGLNENISITLGETTKFVTITSQSGKVNTYEFRLVRDMSHNANIRNIVPSTGSLSPAFNTSIDEYRMTVEGNVTSLNFTVTTEDPTATVKGNRNNTLSDGANTIIITATAEDGVTTSTVTITVYKKIEIRGIKLDDVIDVPIGDTTNLEVEFVPSNTDYKELTYSVKDPSILTVDENGVITPKVLGSTLVTVTSRRYTNISKTVTVNVIQPKILSDVYYINRDIEYISGFEPDTSLEEFVSNLKNDRTWIHLYDETDNEISDLEETVVATKLIVKLELNDKVYDQLTLVLKGDVDGNGMIVVTDITRIKNYILSKIELDDIELAAADVDCNDMVVVTDITRVKNYILSKIDTLNEEVLKLRDSDD